MTVLILAEQSDVTVDRVVAALNRRGVPVFRCDTGWFPANLAVSAYLDGDRWAGVLRTSHWKVDLVGLRSVWYRRPTAFAFPDTMSAPERRHAAMEAKYGLGGVLNSLPVLWANHPAAEADASYKPRQLVTAQVCGLEAPRTLITNQPAAVRNFARDIGKVLIKPVGSMYVFEEDQVKAAHTRILTHEDLSDLAGGEVTAHLFQEWLDKAYEVRLTVVGERLFPVAIHAGSDAAWVDWRTDYDALSYEVVQAPEPVVAGVRRYMQSFGLTFGAFDFVVAPDGAWRFLECNSGGQFGWIEHRTGLPISDGIADLLQEGQPQ
ncbi:MAG: ATP-grasp ribosomal peptide maturase [Micromonosporaceae bacterium]